MMLCSIAFTVYKPVYLNQKVMLFLLLTGVKPILQEMSVTVYEAWVISLGKYAGSGEMFSGCIMIEQ